MMPDETVMQRLAFIKYLYSVAVEQSQRPEPLSSASILTFHDAIELFLQLSSEHLDVGKKDVNFMEYWNLLGKKLQGDGLSQKESMRRLNSARVALKHHGTRPSKLDIEGFRASATNFFEENTQIVFYIGFSDVSLIEMVQCQDTKDNLKKAKEMLKENKIEDALDKVALAFTQLIDDYESRKRDRFGRSPFFFGHKMDFVNSDLMNIRGPLGRLVDRIKESLEPLQDVVRIISLGIEYRRYVKFRLLTPNIIRIPPGEYHIQRLDRGSKGIATPEDVQFCIDFVIESAISLQQFDFSL